MPFPMRFLPLAALLVVGSAACASDGDERVKVAVTGGDTDCEIAVLDLPAGPISFDFKNTSSKVNELYVMTEDDEVKGEVENVTTGATRTVNATLSAGNYKVVCKPGMEGAGITEEFQVAGSSTEAQPKPSRTIGFDGVDYAFEGLDFEGVKAGDTVQFEMKNGGTVAHEFEVFGPDGKVLGEIGPTDVGKAGKVTLTLAEKGDYKFVCAIDDHESRGMQGFFTL